MQPLSKDQFLSHIKYLVENQSVDSPSKPVVIVNVSNKMCMFHQNYYSGPSGNYKCSHKWIVGSPYIYIQSSVETL